MNRKKIGEFLIPLCCTTLQRSDYSRWEMLEFLLYRRHGTM